MKSRRFIGSIAGLFVGVVLVGIALLFEIPKNSLTSFISMLSIPAALLTLGYHHLFHPSEAFLKGVFYCFLIVQWSMLGLFGGWISDLVTSRQRRKES